MWYDFFKVFGYAFAKDPLSQSSNQGVDGAGVSQPDAVPDLRSGSDSTWGGGGSGGNSIRLRDTTEFVDLTSVTNRMHRYKEYERLRNMPEIEMAMTVFADETCFAGETIVETPNGQKTLKSLAEKNNGKFLCYCYDFEKGDYTLGWAHSARKTKKAKTIKVLLNDGKTFICTPDHKILLRNGKYKAAGDLTSDDLLMPFYRENAREDLTELKENQFARIWTHNAGWMHERQFFDEWSNQGKSDPKLKKVNEYCRLIANGMTARQVHSITGNDSRIVKNRLKKAGFSINEIKWLATKKDHKRVMMVEDHDCIDVYDITVDKHHNFATDWGIAHNCQRDDDGRVFQIMCGNDQIKEELEYVMFHRKMLNFDQNKMWDMAKRLFIMGDFFYEILIDIDDPKGGIIGLTDLPADSMYRVETTQGRLVEFQQGKEGPDYESLKKVDVLQATDSDLEMATAIRFAPEQVIHIKIGDDRKTFYPYGVSLMEAARGPAHQLRLMEDSMVTYRLVRAPERRVFYIDVAKLPPHKAEAFISRMKDQLKKKKVSSRRGGQTGASAVEERWHAPDADEDLWIPTRPDANTRVETLPGACLALNTKIPLLDGSDDELSTIIERWNAGEELWAYSCNPKTGEMVPGLVTWAGVTRKKADLVKVTFDNGESVTCTPDHKFPVIGREGKIEAQNLNIGDSLIPFKTRKMKVSKNTKDYQQIYDPFHKKWIFVHRMVAEYGNLIQSKVYKEEYATSEKNVVHHVDFDELNNNPNNLNWMNWIDHKCFHSDMPKREETRNKISRGIKKFHSQLTECEKSKRDDMIKEINTNAAIINEYVQLNQHIARQSVKFNEGITRDHFDKLVKSRGFEGSRELRVYLSGKIKDRSCKSTETSMYGKSTLNFPKALFSYFMHRLADGVKNVDSILEEINSNPEFMKIWKNENKHVKRKGVDVQKGLKRTHVLRMVKSHGYKSLNHAREEAKLYNHTVVSIEVINDKQDVGTLTIDGNETYHDYHTFAISACGVMTYNSNLGEIDDTVYFRNKLFTALNFPRNYFNNEDVQSTRIALSAQDVKFARMIERLQSHIETALWNICERHLTLLGYPEESFEDLEVKMTPPSDWRELTRAEVVTNRLTNAGSLKGSLLMSDFDILTKWMKYSEEEAKKMLARLKIQKLEELKLQIIAQNPQLLGIGIPGPDEEEIGTEAGGPNPMLGAEEAPPMPAQAQGMRKYMDDENEDAQQSDQGFNNQQQMTLLPDVSSDEIKRYNLEIQDFAKEVDYEEIDFSEN